MSEARKDSGSQRRHLKADIDFTPYSLGRKCGVVGVSFVFLSEYSVLRTKSVLRTEYSIRGPDEEELDWLEPGLVRPKMPILTPGKCSNTGGEDQ